ncbi:EAL domain-containing protein [Marinobacter sp.]|uniref:EAL domain-containing protein n=1 Tax=Marinobacter sp. TaxID=50741 RepID=UPI00384ACBEF
MRLKWNRLADRNPTLRTLLLSYTGGLILVLSLVGISISFDRFRDYVADQLQDHAQGAATALGLSLSHAIDGRDTVAASSLIDAVFDRGRYLEVSYLDVRERLIAGRKASLDDLPVPDWFTAIASLPRPTARADVVRGWQRLGSIRVTSSPAQGYRDLWRITWSVVTAAATIGGVALVLLYYFLARTLRPLRAIEVQADAVGRRDFRQRLNVSSTRELNRVAHAMNQMADDLGQLFEGQAKLVQHLRKLNNEDAVTALASIRAFDQRLRVEVESQERPATGALMLVQLYNFGEVNQLLGREQADQLLIHIADALRAFMLDHTGSFGGRRTGAEFAIFVPGVALPDALFWCRQLVAELDGLYADFVASVEVAVHGGVAGVEAGMSARDLFAASDQALRHAQASESSACSGADQSLSAQPGAESWRRMIAEGLEQGRMQLWQQPVFATAGQQLFSQLVVRLRLGDGWIQAGVFAPMAERFGFMPGMDLMVLERTLDLLRADTGRTLAITLGNSSVADETFRDNLLARLGAVPQIRRRLLVGIHEHSVHHHQGGARVLVRELRKLGVGVIVDGFGVGGVPFSYLRNLPFEAVRIDQSFVHDIARHEDHQFYLESIAAIAHSRGVKVFVSGVETASEWQIVQKLGVDGGMGYHLGRPAPIGS